MVFERKRDLLKDNARHFGIAHQSKHNGSDSLLAQPARKRTAPGKGRVNRRATIRGPSRVVWAQGDPAHGPLYRVKSDTIRVLLAVPLSPSLLQAPLPANP